jgi:hypothetical protein
VDDDELVCLENVEELDHIGHAHQALQYFGFPSDDTYGVRVQALLVDDLQSRCFLVLGFMRLADKLVLDYHHDAVAALT